MRVASWRRPVCISTSRTLLQGCSDVNQTVVKVADVFLPLPWEMVGLRAQYGHLRKNLPGFSPLSEKCPQSILQRLRFYEEFLTRMRAKAGSNVWCSLAQTLTPTSSRVRGSQTLPLPLLTESFQLLAA